MGLIQFSGYDTQPEILLALRQLARALSRNPNLDVVFGYHARMLRLAGQLEISRFWDTVPASERQDGYTSDVYLKAYAEPRFTQIEALERLLRESQDTPNPSWCRQLFLLGEELRIEQAAVRERNGMRRTFAVRRKALRRYYAGRVEYHAGRGQWSDAALCMMFAMLTAEDGPPVWTLPPILEQVRSLAERRLYDLYELPDTAGVAGWAADLTEMLAQWLSKPCAMTYWSPSIDGPEPASNPPGTSASSKKDRLEPTSAAQTVSKKTSQREETFALRPRDERHGSEPMLRFSLNRGPNGGWLGNRDVRRGDAGDQSLAIVQGTSEDNAGGAGQESAPAATLSDDVSVRSANSGVPAPVRGVYAVELKPKRPTGPDMDRYRRYVAEVAPLKRRLRVTLKKHLEQKRLQSSRALHAGRLGRNLTDLWIEELPRLFVKRNQPSPKWDAAIVLLVDCSASMADKMERVQAGLTLLHETLSSLAVPHAVCGFWEPQSIRVSGSSGGGIPNCFLPVIPFERSLSKQSGPEILQLEPQEDNRDGFAIRHAASWLRARPERRKWLIVFSDGQPSAQDYAEVGVLDTYEAVRETRRDGIDVFGLHLAGHSPSDKEIAAMRAVYGRAGAVVPDLASLPDRLHRLLKAWLIRPGS